MMENNTQQYFSEIFGEWKKSIVKNLLIFYCSLNAIRLILSSTVCCVEHVARMGKNNYRVLVGKDEGNGPLGRPNRRWEGNNNNNNNNNNEIKQEGNDRT